jgi:hypothetical protein
MLTDRSRAVTGVPSLENDLTMPRCVAIIPDWWKFGLDLIVAVILFRSIVFSPFFIHHRDTEFTENIFPHPITPFIGVIGWGKSKPTTECILSATCMMILIYPQIHPDE